VGIEMKRIIIWTVCLLACSSSAFAATYYVSTSGNDGNVGSLSSPWRNIQKCANTINGGDVCIVNDGTYTESIIISRSGSSGNTITIQAANVRKAIVSGSFNLSGNYIKIDGFHINLGSSSTVGVAVSGTGDAVTNCLIDNPLNSEGYYVVGISIGGTGAAVSNNYITNVCFGFNVPSGSSSAVIQNNEVYHTHKPGGASSMCSDTDYMRIFGTGHLVKNNYFHGIDMANLYGAHPDCFQTFDNGGPTESLSDTIFDGNYCQDASSGAMFDASNYRRSDNIIFRNNVWKGMTAWCADIGSVSNVKFYNNTCDMVAANGVRGYHGLHCNAPGASCEFKNNIIYNPTDFIYGMDNGGTLISASNNLLYKSGVSISGFPNDVKNQDPLFVSPASQRLQATSPARGAGTMISGWTNPTDKAGVSRSQGPAWDIGAYKYGVSNLNSPSNFRKLGP
jgi:hypothetical protein